MTVKDMKNTSPKKRQQNKPSYHNFTQTSPIISNLDSPRSKSSPNVLFPGYSHGYTPRKRVISFPFIGSFPINRENDLSFPSIGSSDVYTEALCLFVQPDNRTCKHQRKNV